MGGGGGILHYTGETWEVVSSASSVKPTLNSIYMLSPREGRVAGDFGMVLRYKTPDVNPVAYLPMLTTAQAGGN